MAYGGGTFMTQNKVMPGAYIVFASIARASATISDRGVAAAPFELSWGEPGVVREITQGEFIKNCWGLFGYSYTDDKMLYLRELFKHAIKAFVYRMPASGAAKATSTFADAKYVGERGNDIRIVVTKLTKESNDDPQPFLVEVYVDGKVADSQRVTAFADLKNNAWVDWIRTITVKEDVANTYAKATAFDAAGTYYTVASTTPTQASDLASCYEKSGDDYVKTSDTEINSGKTYYALSSVAEPAASGLANYYEQKKVDNTYTYKFTDETARDGVSYYTTTTLGETTISLSGGGDGTVQSSAPGDFLAAIEPYSFNTLCCPYTSQTIIGQFISHTKEQRDQYGVKFQLVCYKPSSADYEGVIGLWNDATHDSISGVSPAAAVYWLTGAEAAAPINGSLTNTKYDGELTIAVDTRQLDLENHIKRGELVFHRSNGDIVILTDINSLVTLRENFGSMFQKNQTIRFCDNVANDLARLFVKRYLGIVQNDESGRASWWNECVKYFRESQRIRAITEFDESIVSVEIGDEKDTVVTDINGLNIVNAMEKLYMTVICK